MSSVMRGILGRMNWPRVAIITVLFPFAALLLTLIVAVQGDPDLPPYIPATPAERVCSAVAAVVVWPAVVAARCWRDGDHGFIMAALFLLSGVFWAVLVEFLFLAKHARKA